jgi:hypothetical protein
MDLKALYFGLETRQRAQFCRLARTTDGYMRIHVVHARKIPRPEFMDRLLVACRKFDETITKDQLLSFFYEQRPAKAA